jgi:hypothetical protein
MHANTMTTKIPKKNKSVLGETVGNSISFIALLADCVGNGLESCARTVEVAGE